LKGLVSDLGSGPGCSLNELLMRDYVFYCVGLRSYDEALVGHDECPSPPRPFDSSKLRRILDNVDLGVRDLKGKFDFITSITRIPAWYSIFRCLAFGQFVFAEN